MHARLALLVILSALAACAAPSASPPAPAPAAARPTLRIANWDTYIDPALLDQFSAREGVAISYNTYDSDEDLLTMLRADPGAYDVVVPGDYMVAIMRREELLAPIEHAAIPNLANLDPLFISPAFDPGNRHCVPYLWGTIGFGYDLRATGRPINSWAEALDPALAGQVALLDHPRNTLGAVLLALGYSPNTTSPTEIAEARDFLIARAAHFSAYSADDAQQLLAGGQAAVIFEWSGDILQVAADNPALGYSIPAEGSIVWTDSLCIPAESPNRELAQRFLNFILEPQVGADLANYTRYSSPNRAALPLINEADRANPALYPDEGLRRRLFFLVDIGSEATELYNQAWADVKDGRP